MKLKTATGPIKWYMKLCHFRGWASFWDTIYVMPGSEHVDWLIRHELKHLEQMERDGKVLFTIKYIWWLLRYGYYGPHPYEAEARRAERV